MDREGVIVPPSQCPGCGFYYAHFPCLIIVSKTLLIFQTCKFSSLTKIEKYGNISTDKERTGSHLIEKTTSKKKKKTMASLISICWFFS